MVEEGEIVSGLDALPQESDAISLSGDPASHGRLERNGLTQGTPPRSMIRISLPSSKLFLSLIIRNQVPTKLLHRKRSKFGRSSFERALRDGQAGGFIHNANPVAYNDRLTE